jgi:hypothetical protein
MVVRAEHAPYALTSCAVGLLTHPAAIAPGRRDSAGARRVGRPAARSGVVVLALTYLLAPPMMEVCVRTKGQRTSRGRSGRRLAVARDMPRKCARVYVERIEPMRR